MTTEATRMRDLVIGAVVLVAGAYVVARTASVPLSYDEATSLVRYLEGDVASVFDFSTATNHWLTTLGMRGAVTLFGYGEWALRLPALGATGLFLAGVVAIARRMRQPAIGVATAVLFVANPYVLDYLTLALGYGLALGFEMAMLAGLMAWLGDDDPVRRLRRLAAMFACGAGAVASNFTMWSFVLGIAAVVTTHVLLWGRTDAHARPAVVPVRRAAALGVVAFAFAWVVFAQERVHGREDFVPVEVRTYGLLPEERAAIGVLWTDATGRPRPLRPDESGTFAAGPLQASWDTLRIVLPPTTEQNLSRLVVRVGEREFERTRTENGPWVVLDRDGQRVLRSRPPLRWRPDRAHRRRAVLMAALVVAALTAAAIVGHRALLLAARHGVDTDALSAVGRGLLAAAALSMAPLYLLARDGELFYGGRAGIVADSVGSLLRGLAYGAEPSLWMSRVTATAVVVLVGVGFSLPRRPGVSGASTQARFARALAMLVAVLVFSVEAQHTVLGVPFPLGRTALYLWPPAVALGLAVADAWPTRGRPAARAAISILGVLGCVAALSTARAVNLDSTLDWPLDRMTPQALAAVAAEPNPGPVRLAVGWRQFPVARYYARRLAISRGRDIDVIALPGDDVPVDYVLAVAHEWQGAGTSTELDAVHGVRLWRLTDE